MMYPNWVSALANHLWQSTVFVAAAWLLAFTLRNNQARIRYWVWLSASLKFLMPFSVLVEAGRRIGSAFAVPVAQPAVSFAMEQMVQVTQPFGTLPRSS